MARVKHARGVRTGYWPKPVRGVNGAIAPMRMKIPPRAMSEFLNLNMVFLLS
jgi:hypothetical protein